MCAMSDTLALSARPPVLRVGTCRNRIGHGAIDMSGLLASVVVVIVVAVISLALRSRGCALALAVPLGFRRSGSDGWRRVRHDAVAGEE